MKISHMRKILDIISRTSSLGEDEWWDSGAEYNMIFLNIDDDKLSQENREFLETAGCYFDNDDGYFMYT